MDAKLPRDLSTGRATVTIADLLARPDARRLRTWARHRHPGEIARRLGVSREEADRLARELREAGAGSSRT